MNGLKISHRTVFLITAVLLGAAAPAWAQFCPDTPVRVGVPGASASVGFGDQSTSYTLGIQAAPRDHLLLDASYSALVVDDVDTSHGLSTGAAYEIPLADGAFCPWGGLGFAYGFGSDGFSRSFSTSVSFGVTAGAVAYEDERYRFTPFVRPTYGYGSLVADVFDGGWHGSWNVAAGALLLANDQIFATGTASFNRDGYSGFTLRLGLMLH